MSHGVDPFPNDTPRTIRIAVNSSWDHLSAREGGYRVGHPSEMTVRILEKDTSPPPTPTPAPSSALHAAYIQRPRHPPPHQGLDRRAGLVRGRHPRLRRPLRLRRLLCPHPLLRRRRPQDQHPGLPQLSGPDRAQHQAQLRRQRLRPRQPRPLTPIPTPAPTPTPTPTHQPNPNTGADPNTYPAAYFDSGAHSNARAYPRTHPGTHANHHDSGDSHGHGSTDGGPRRCSDSGTGPAGHRGACASTNATRLGGACDPNNRRCNTAHPQYLGRHCVHSTATHHADSDPGLRHRVCHRRVRVPDIA